MKKKSSISIIIPCFNEEPCIPKLFEALFQQCKNIQNIEWKIINAVLEIRREKLELFPRFLMVLYNTNKFKKDINIPIIRNPK